MKKRYHMRVTMMFGMSTLVTIAIALLSSLGECDDTITYWVLLGLVFLIGMCSAVMQAALAELTAGLTSLKGNFDLGMFVSMIIVNLGRMILMAIFGNKNDTGTYICFAITIVYLLACTIFSGKFIKCFNQVKQIDEITNNLLLENEAAEEWSMLKEPKRNEISNKVFAVYKQNWKEAIGVLGTTTMQLTFFPGVMLSL